MKMLSEIKMEENSSHPIDLDQKQLKELDKLIESLKKEVVFPGEKTGRQIGTSKVGR